MTTENPFSFALNLQREILDSSVGLVQRGTVAVEQIERIADADVGQTPSEVVYEENKLELLHYEPAVDDPHGTPILAVYALINKPFILDLQPDRSVVRRLLEAGHDVYLIDWNEPSRLDKHLTLDDYVNRYIDNCVDVVRARSGADRINVLGYCMGGTMSAIYTALHQEKVQALALMASGLCFDGDGGVLERWGDAEHYDPQDVVDAYGNVPAEMLDVGFALMDPVANFVSKYVRLYDNLEDDDFVENFARMERWLSEGIDVAGETYVQFLEDIYQDNKLYTNEMFVGGRHVDVESIEIPILQVIGEYDHLIPPETSIPFNDVVASEDTDVIEHPTGHIGLSVSGSSHHEVWPNVAEWFREKSPDDPATIEHGEVGGVDEAVEIEIDSSDGREEGAAPVDVEPSDDIEAAIDGVGQTYGERLREAGFDTVDSLAGADASAVATAADVGLRRAENWLEQARSDQRSGSE